MNLTHGEGDSNMNTIPRTSPVQHYSIDQLESALRDADDLFARAAIPYIMIGNIAKQMVNNEKLSGDGIDIAVRGNEVTGTAISTIKTLQPEVEITKDGFTYYWMETPIRVHFVDSDNEFFKRPDKVWHNAWEYFIPNPFKEYLATL